MVAVDYAALAILPSAPCPSRRVGTLTEHPSPTDNEASWFACAADGEGLTSPVRQSVLSCEASREISSPGLLKYKIDVLARRELAS